MAAHNIPTYYTDLQDEALLEALRNFDDPANLQFFTDAVSSQRSRNFLVDFGDREAWSGFDLEPSSLRHLLRAPRPLGLNTRWINIWIPHQQKEALTVLAKHYDFTPRLLGFMCSSPVKPERSIRSSKGSSVKSAYFWPASKTVANAAPTIAGSSATSQNGEDSAASASGTSPDGSQTVEASVDIESGIQLGEISITAEPDLSKTMNQYALASDLWHYSTMDWGRRYVCLGYNTLHVVHPSANDDFDDQFSDDLPRCKRIWSWLILCDDKTVITISEDPYPHRSTTLKRQEQQNLGIMRRNLINVFRQCSKARDPLAEITPLVLPLRIRVGDYEHEDQRRVSDIPGLLFYYLFDDWLSIYSLIARSDNRFALELNDLRLRMLSRAELQHVDRLHHLGRQLAVLKRVYHSYDLLIDRLLGKREVTLGMLQTSHALWSGLESMDSSQPNVAMAESNISVGVSLTSAAKVRFERLKHRIQLFAMNEVSECIDQKDSLVMMNFNLLAIKEALTVERLTEVTLLLAKVTILFMPVSLLTAYFSCQFTDYEFSYVGYWKWFGGIFATSIVALTAFTLLSGTKEGHIITKPLSKRFLDFSGKHVRRRISRGSGLR